MNWANSYREIKSIIHSDCNQVLTSLGSSFFSFVRVFKNFHYISIGTYPTEYIKEYREKVRIPHPQVIKTINIASISGNSSIIWPGGTKPKKNDTIANLSSKFNMGSKLTIVHKHSNYYDIFFFVSSLSDNNKEIFFAAHTNLMSQFSQFFIQKYSNILQNFPMELEYNYTPFQLEQSEQKIDTEISEAFYKFLTRENKKINCFSTREVQCLERIAQGKTYKEIALDLSLSPRSIESYVDNIRNKTNLTFKKDIRDFWLNQYKQFYS